MSMSLSKKSYPLGPSTSLDVWIFVDKFNNFWFRAKEVALILNYVNTRQAIISNVSDEDISEWKDIRDNDLDNCPNNWHPNTIFLNVSGLFSLIIASRKIEAQQFKRWVTSEVLPAICYYGAYISPNINQNQLQTLLSILQEKDRQIEKKNCELREKDEKIAELKANYDDLSNKVFIQVPKVAVIPQKENLRHELRVYLVQPNTYRFIRTQKRNLTKALKHLNLSTANLVIHEEFIPNGINVLNRVKELIPQNEYIPFYNCIITEHDIPALVKQVLDELHKPVEGNYPF